MSNRSNDIVQGEAREWSGLTLEQLRYRRALALVKREMGRAAMEQNVTQVRTSVDNNGVRGLLFSSKTNARLKKVDVLLLGFKLGRSVYKMWRRMR